MRNWLLRGLVFAAVMVAVRLVQGTIVNAWPTQAGLVSIVLLLLFVIGVEVWSVLDGRADATANPDPDRREDLAMTWLLAGLVAGVLSGAICWLISVVYSGLYTGGFLNEVTTFAAFTALLVFLPAVVGVAVGRWRVDRNPPPRPGGDAGDAGDERADTDVFTAVRANGDATQASTGEAEPAAALAVQGATTATATLPDKPETPAETVAAHQPEAPTEAIPTGPWGGTTEPVPAAEDDAKTEVLDLKPDPVKQPEKDSEKD